MPNNKLKLEHIWDLTAKEELLTVLWAIFTVLLYTSDINFLQILSWFTGGWTVICTIGIAKSVWPTNKVCHLPEETEQEIYQYLENTFSTGAFIYADESGRKEHIASAAGVLYEMTKNIYQKGQKNE